MIQTLATAVLMAAAMGGIAYALLFPMLSGERRASLRRKALVPGVDEIAAGSRVVRGAPRTARERVSKSMKDTEAREKSKGKPTLEDQFEQAGVQMTRQKYYIMSAVAACALAFLALVLIGHPIGVLVGAIVGGLGIPRWVLGFLMAKRQKKFVAEFPNALDVITRGLKSGLPLNDCVRIISVEASEPVRGEFRRLMEQQALGISLPEGIEDMARRIPLAETSYFAIIIALQQKTGGNLAETLANMSKVVRERKKLSGKIKALSAEAKSSAAIIAGMPVFVAVTVGVTTPSYMEKLYNTQAGQFTIVGCLIWMLMGVLVMRKMINFKF
jgi:tight adherence protein B